MQKNLTTIQLKPRGDGCNGKFLKNSLNDMRGKGKSRGSKGPSYQHNMNWNHKEMMALITYKHKEHITLKQVIDP
jgi:hypothetical protein